MATGNQIMRAFRFWYNDSARVADPISLLEVQPGQAPDEAGWKSPGSGRGGATFNIDTEWTSYSLDDFLREPGRQATGGRVYAGANLGEITLTNLRLALNDATITPVTVANSATGTYGLLEQTSEQVLSPKPRAVAFHGLDKGGNQHLLVIRDTLSVANLSLALQKAEQTQLAMEWTANEIDETVSSFGYYGPIGNVI